MTEQSGYEKGLKADKSFDLLTEPWVPVIYLDGTQTHLSLFQVFEQSHLIVTLNGEMEVLNAAFLRFLISILYASLLRTDNQESLAWEDEDEVFCFWKDLWTAGKLPYNKIINYLNLYSEHFWLFHPQTPFMQSYFAIEGYEKKEPQLSAEKLLCDVLKSGNKRNFFRSRMSTEEINANYIEAAQGLIFLQAYDDAGVKKTKRYRELNNNRNEVISPGVSWCGKLGQVYFQGKNLFETLLLNFVLLKNGDDFWPEQKPFWEMNIEHKERDLIDNPPDNPAELLSQPTRWVLLSRSNNEVNGFYRKWGRFFDSKNCFTEQYTLWKIDTKNGGFSPKAHDSNKYSWRDFSSLIPMQFITQEENKAPGVVMWVKALHQNNCIESDTHLMLKFCGVQYLGSMKSKLKETYGDDLSFHASLLNFSPEWLLRICDEIKKVEDLAEASTEMAKDIALASGVSYDQVNTDEVGGELLFQMINFPFRNWLDSLEGERQFVEEDRIEEWHSIIRKIANELIDLHEKKAPTSAIYGRKVKSNSNSKTSKSNKMINLISAEMKFRSKLNKLYPKEKNHDQAGTYTRSSKRKN